MLTTQIKVKITLLRYKLVFTVSHVSMLFSAVQVYKLQAVVEHLAKNAATYSR